MRLHVFVSGHVQGVFFRSNVSEFCNVMGLTGFVRNLVDGRVEVVAYGSKDKLDELLKFIKKNPGASNVTDVSYSFSGESGDYSSFSVR